MLTAASGRCKGVRQRQQSLGAPLSPMPSCAKEQACWATQATRTPRAMVEQAAAAAAAAPVAFLPVAGGRARSARIRVTYCAGTMGTTKHAWAAVRGGVLLSASKCSAGTWPLDADAAVQTGDGREGGKACGWAHLRKLWPLLHRPGGEVERPPGVAQQGDGASALRCRALGGGAGGAREHLCNGGGRRRLLPRPRARKVDSHGRTAWALPRAGADRHRRLHSQHQAGRCPSPCRGI